MDNILTLPGLAELVKQIGFPGVVLVLWFLTYRDQGRILQQYQRDMQEQRKMYENNVELVKRVLTIADEQQEIIIMNTRIQQSLVDRIESNQFCPMVRLKKVEGTPV